jgi:hypothetical protein
VAPAAATRPLLPPGIEERFLPAPAGAAPLYRPSLLGVARLHYVHAKSGVDEWVQAAWLAPLAAGSASAPWDAAQELGRAAPELAAEPVAGARFAELAPDAGRAESFERWRRMLATQLVRARPLELLTCTAPKAASKPGESEGEFRARLRDALRAARDGEVEKLRRRYAPELAKLRDGIARATQRVEVEREQYSQRKVQTAISIGATVVGALFGRKLGNASNVGRATTAMRGLGRAADERGDVGRAEERADALRDRLAELEKQLAADVAALEAGRDPATVPLEVLAIAPRKSDLEVAPLVLVWAPEREPS